MIPGQVPGAIPPAESPIWGKKWCSTLCMHYRQGTCPHRPSCPDTCGWGATIKEMHPDDWTMWVSLYTDEIAKACACDHCPMADTGECYLCEYSL